MKKLKLGLSQMSYLGSCYRAVFRLLKEKCDLTEFNGKVHPITYCMQEICQGESGENWCRLISMGTGDAKG